MQKSVLTQVSGNTMPIGQLIGVFRAALLAVIPYVDQVGIRWKKYEAYDDWERIEDSLFKSMVSVPIEFIFGEGQGCLFPIYNNLNYQDCSESLLYDEDLGQQFRFLSLTHEVGIFESACFIATDRDKNDHPLIEKNLATCRFAALVKATRSDDAQVTRVGLAGSNKL